jgi:hypothetical protein
MSTARYLHTATLMNNGMVLVTGGYGGSYLSSAEVYGPRTSFVGYTMSSGGGNCGQMGQQSYTDWTFNTFYYADQLGVTHSFNLSGVFFNSPGGSSCPPNGAQPLPVPWVGTATDGSGYQLSVNPGQGGPSVTLKDVNGNTISVSVIANATTGSFTLTGAMHTAREGHIATLMNSGTVLVSGGYNGSYLNGAEVYQYSSVIPLIANLSPPSGPIGTLVTIAGTNFGATQGSNTVTFNGIPGNPQSWSSTQIVVPVPAGATTGPVIVTVGGLTSNSVLFTVTAAPPPVITGISPDTGTAGTSVTISGTGFGTTQATSTVTFNGVLATPTSWNATTIVVPVPTGATSGRARSGIENYAIAR